MVSRLINVAFSLKGSTAPLMVCIPIIRIAKPSMILPIFLYTERLLNILSTIPTTATMAEIVAVERTVAQPPVPSI